MFKLKQMNSPCVYDPPPQKKTPKRKMNLYHDKRKHDMTEITSPEKRMD